MNELHSGEKGGVILIGADGRWDMGTVLFVQRAVNNRAVLQGHLWADKSVTTPTYQCSKSQHPPDNKARMTHF